MKRSERRRWVLAAVAAVLPWAGCGDSTTGPGGCSTRDEASCTTARGSLQSMYDEATSCSPGDSCVVVNGGIEGAPFCAPAFRCPFAVRQGVDLAALAARVKAVDDSGCRSCATCPAVTCVAPAASARCNPAQRTCELVR